MNNYYKIGAFIILALFLSFVVILFVEGNEPEGTPIPSVPFIPLNRNGEKGFWMNIETAKEVAWAMKMAPVYQDSLEEAEEAASKLDNALDTAIGINIERDRKIENLERWKVGLIVANLFQAIMNAGGIFVW